MTDPQKHLERMCRRHGVPLDGALRLLPLVARALGGKGELRRRILAVVDAALARDALEIAERLRIEEHLDRHCLVAVAHVLHDWKS